MAEARLLVVECDVDEFEPPKETDAEEVAEEALELLPPPPTPPAKLETFCCGVEMKLARPQFLLTSAAVEDC